MEYLEETHPEPALLPKDAFQRAIVRRITQLVVSDTQPIQNMRVLKHVGEKWGETEKMEWAKHWITQSFVALETLLQTTAGRFCVGDEVSMADIVVVPQVFNAGRFNVDMTAFPTISSVCEACQSLPAFKAAHPTVQPDAVQ
eukprot:EC716069.1.p2 GENE.EC716069.1~~EC716069.1.p2  ORF type:complete len:142 (+),score=48.10 EC716069.1:74-499(+)